MALSKEVAHSREGDLHEVLNAIFYLQCSGCQWELLLHNFPLHQTVYKYFRKHQRQGIWQAIHEELWAEVRRERDREADSSVAIADRHPSKQRQKADATPRQFPARGNVHQAGASTVLTVARTLKGVSAISS